MHTVHSTQNGHTDNHLHKTTSRQETIMSRLTQIIVLTIALLSLTTLLASAQEPTTGTVDAMDRAYLVEYHQRAVEKYASIPSQTTIADGPSDWMGEGFLAEYGQRAVENYAAISRLPAVVNTTPDWMGEGFLVEYDQQAVESYAIWLAGREIRLAERTD